MIFVDNKVAVVWTTIVWPLVVKVEAVAAAAIFKRKQVLVGTLKISLKLEPSPLGRPCSSPFGLIQSAMTAWSIVLSRT